MKWLQTVQITQLPIFLSALYGILGAEWSQFFQALEENGQGRVLVVDSGGSLRCAVLGDNLAEMGHKNGWSVSCLGRPLPRILVSL